MNELVESWLAAQIPSTRKPYATAARDLLRTIGEVEQLLAGPEQARELIAAYRADLAGRGLAASTEITRIGAIRSLLAYAKAVGLIDWRLELSPSCWGPRSESAVGLGEERCDGPQEG